MVGNDPANAAMFDKLTKARDVLSDADLRHAYDQGGWELVEHIKNMRNVRQHQRLKCEPTIIRQTVSLDQLYRREKIKVEASIPGVSEDGTVCQKHFEQMIPAYTVGKVMIECQGIEKPNSIPGDIVVILELDEDCPFRVTRGNDLVYVAKLDFRYLFGPKDVLIPHPAGPARVFHQYQINNESSSEDNTLIFPGLGLPKPNSGADGSSGERADLVVIMELDLSCISWLDEKAQREIDRCLQLGDDPTDSYRKFPSATDITELARTPAQMRARDMGMGMGEAMTGECCIC